MLGAIEHVCDPLIPDVLATLRGQLDGDVGLRVDRFARPVDAVAAGELGAAIVMNAHDHPAQPLGAVTLRSWTSAALPADALPDPLPLVAYGAPCGLRDAQLRHLDEAGLAWTTTGESEHLAGVHAAVRSGPGVALLAGGADGLRRIETGRSASRSRCRSGSSSPPIGTAASPSRSGRPPGLRARGARGGPRPERACARVVGRVRSPDSSRRAASTPCPGTTDPRPPATPMDRRPLAPGPTIARIADRRQGPLADPRFRLLFLGQLASAAGTALVPVALAFAVLDAGGGPGALGLVLAASRLPLVLFTLIGGVLADRLPRQRVMLASDLVRTLAQGATAILLLRGHVSIPALALLQAAHATAAAFFNPAATGLTPQTVAPAQLQRANALMGLARSTTGVGAQVLAGVLVAAFGAASVFAIDAGTYVVSAASLALLRPSGSVVVRAAIGLRQELAGGWREFRARPWIAAGSLHIALLNAFALAPFFVLGPVVCDRWLGGATAWGAVAAAFGLGMIVGGTLATRVEPERPLCAAFAVIVLAAPQFALLAVHAPVALLAAAAALGGGQASFFVAVWTTTLQQHVPPEAISRVDALSSIGMLALAPVAFAAVGPATAATSVSAVLLFGAGWTLLSTAGVLGLGVVRALPRHPTGVAPPTTLATAPRA